jgi:hypothetical protein
MCTLLRNNDPVHACCLPPRKTREVDWHGRALKVLLTLESEKHLKNKVALMLK